jgi:hypothetical protein
MQVPMTRSQQACLWWSHSAPQRQGRLHDVVRSYAQQRNFTGAAGKHAEPSCSQLLNGTGSSVCRASNNCPARTT